MLRTSVLSLAACALLLFSACGGNQNGANTAATNSTPSTTTVQAPAAPTTPQTIVTATGEELKLGAGGGGEAVVRLEIAGGYHVNANPASDKFYLATELKAEPQEGITPGKPVYPPASTKKFQFSETPLAVYEGRAVIKLPLRAAADASKGAHLFRTKIRVQPCNDQGCLPPREVEASIPLTVN
ncbi:MAG: hypothetical protein QOJ76_226 [Acidobacteriota bacterium]|jgi:hypothetical protein|nr:hypothetical protein [Acidobacteriota bacterium]